MSAFTIDEVEIPASLEGPAGDDFRAMTAMRNAVEIDTFGSDEHAYSAEELHPGWLDAYEPKRLLLARVDGAIVGRGVVETRTEGNPDAAWLIVQVLPAFRRRGIGTALADRTEALALADGRTQLLCYAPASAVAGDRIPSPTGFGSVPAADPGVRFLLSRGWSLEQVERCSRLALPVPAGELAERLESAHAASGPEYRLHAWGDRTPAEWLADIAVLATRMSTDAPDAGMDAGEEIWTAERVAESEERHADSPRRQVIVAVEHIPSGRLAGYTELSVPPEPHRPILQGDTIVMREHRGHRLGMLLKLGGIARVQEVHPGRPSIITFNAEENRHMLDVNEAVGFVAVAYEGAWKKVLPAPGTTPG